MSEYDPNEHPKGPDGRWINSENAGNHAELPDDNDPAAYSDLATGANEDNAWVDEAKEDFQQWSQISKQDVLGRDIDWDTISRLDLRNGIGVGPDYPDPVEGAKMDVELQEQVHAAYEKMSNDFLYGDGFKIKSYRAARALAYANRRLDSEIDVLNHRVVTETGGEPVDKLLEKYTKAVSKKSYADKKAAKAKLTKEEIKAADAAYDLAKKEQRSKAFHWMPGQDCNTVAGLDFETTGLYADSCYVIDSGMERMDISPTAPHEDKRSEADKNHKYREDVYSSDNGAYDIASHQYGADRMRIAAGNPAESTNHIPAEEIAKHKPLDENPYAQKQLLEFATSAPLVAHNANFEHHMMMANVDGYAEAYRKGKVRLIDTMHMCQSLPKPEKYKDDKQRPNLDVYMKRWNAIPETSNEVHRGLEDTDGMLVAMKNQMKWMHDNQTGVWNPDYPLKGVGGKRNGDGWEKKNGLK